VHRHIDDPSREHGYEHGYGFILGVINRAEH
jgi:hypothetical protein